MHEQHYSVYHFRSNQTLQRLVWFELTHEVETRHFSSKQCVCDVSPLTYYGNYRQGREQSNMKNVQTPMAIRRQMFSNSMTPLMKVHICSDTEHLGFCLCLYLSQAAILQQTADYIITLEQEKTQLLQQNNQLKRFIQVCLFLCSYYQLIFLNIFNTLKYFEY